ncbi:MAG: arginine--tRNA ligase [Acidobacteria bacterium]|nr:arginine--tRNA ligase [Acidobacteriota bacterium]
MNGSILDEIRASVLARARALYGVDPPEMAMEYPPRAEMGDVASPLAFELAKQLKRNPRAIATEIAAGLPLPGSVAKCEPAGGGFLNFHLKRELVPARLRASLLAPAAPAGERDGKIIVEHTNINPNKAAHIGHLRNAVLGDTLVRLLKHSGRRVEVQNYIDDTGVQVADLVVGFVHLRKMTLDEVRGVDGRFDYYCWDLYSEVTAFYEGDRARLDLRSTALKHMEEGIAPEAPLARYVADRIVRCHLRTMERIGVRYDLLPWESHILAMRFWAKAYEKLKATGAVRRVDEGARAGCWIMDMPSVDDGQGDEAKIIVRSNGTVTYVGKDIAYQLWKFGLLGADFGYTPFETRPDAGILWSTTAADGSEAHPPFGSAREVYNVIDVRQAYLQRVVAQGLRALGHGPEADRSIHFAYEMVALSPACARSLGYAVEEGADARAVEMSGRRGYGVKADDLLDALEREARAEVARRSPSLEAAEIDDIARKVALAALRYFMIRFTRNRVIAFDFEEVLSFEGETGPYILYSIVRAGNILNKLREREGTLAGTDPAAIFDRADWGLLGASPVDDHWELLALLSRFDEMVAAALRTQEPSSFGRYLFIVAQKFNHFYHQFPVLQEPDPGRRAARAAITWLFRETMTRGCGLLGFSVPHRM